MYRYATVTKLLCEAFSETPSIAVRFASTRNNYSDQRPPLVGQRPIQPPDGPLRMQGGPGDIPRANILDLTCQPCEFPPPTTSTPYRKPVAVNFAARKTSVSHRDASGAAEKQDASQNIQLTKERMHRAVTDKTSKELVAKLQISARSLKKANDSLANCFKSTTPSRGTNMNK